MDKTAARHINTFFIVVLFANIINFNAPGPEPPVDMPDITFTAPVTYLPDIEHLPAFRVFFEEHPKKSKKLISKGLSDGENQPRMTST